MSGFGFREILEDAKSRNFRRRLQQSEVPTKTFPYLTFDLPSSTMASIYPAGCYCRSLMKLNCALFWEVTCKTACLYEKKKNNFIRQSNVFLFEGPIEWKNIPLHEYLSITSSAVPLSSVAYILSWPEEEQLRFLCILDVNYPALIVANFTKKIWFALTKLYFLTLCDPKTVNVTVKSVTLTVTTRNIWPF